ncbi:hypothetical protein C8Q74DRAFT_1217391 [Fomes fomentarius]|nr:hypothetical protein C8Q74DRAFT_1217391 [Fomes fomentarius]
MYPAADTVFFLLFPLLSLSFYLYSLQPTAVTVVICTMWFIGCLLLLDVYDFSHIAIRVSDAVSHLKRRSKRTFTLVAVKYLVDSDVVHWLLRKDIADKKKRIQELEQFLSAKDKTVLRLEQLLASAKKASDQANEHIAAKEDENAKLLKAIQAAELAQANRLSNQTQVLTAAVLAKYTPEVIQSIPEYLVASHPMVQQLKRQVGSLKRAVTEVKKSKDDDIRVLAADTARRIASLEDEKASLLAYARASLARQGALKQEINRLSTEFGASKEQVEELEDSVQVTEECVEDLLAQRNVLLEHLGEVATHHFECTECLKRAGETLSNVRGWDRGSQAEGGQ